MRPEPLVLIDHREQVVTCLLWTGGLEFPAAGWPERLERGAKRDNNLPKMWQSLKDQTQ